MPWWARLSSAAAPLLLIGGWSLAAGRQPSGFDSATDTISALAGLGATDRWLMTVALAGVGICHLVTALGLRAAAAPGRAMLAVGGLATVLVAAFPLPYSGSSPAHTASATAAFVALAVWPALSWRREPQRPPVPAGLRLPVPVAAAAVLLGLLGWFAMALSDSDRVGLAERVAAGAQALWPLLVVLSARAVAPAHAKPDRLAG